MKNTKKYRPIFLIILFVLALCLVHTANARADELTCLECAHEWLWEADGKPGDDLEDDSASVTYTDDGLLINNFKKNYTLCYSFKIPETGKNYLNWHANLQVRNATGVAAPGICFDNGSTGFSFRVDRNRSLGSFVLTSVNISSVIIDEFDVPKFNYPCTIGMRYDVVTREITAYLNDTPVKKVTLPYYGIPAFANIRGVCIKTTTPPHSSIGTVLYGDLRLAAAQ